MAEAIPRTTGPTALMRRGATIDKNPPRWDKMRRFLIMDTFEFASVFNLAA